MSVKLQFEFIFNLHWLDLCLEGSEVITVCNKIEMYLINLWKITYIYL